jgi:hypothetical protein
MTIAGRILRAIATLFQNLKSEVKKTLPLAVIIVNGAKDLVTNPTSGSIFDAILEFVKKAVPNPLADALIDKIHQALHNTLPKLALNLTILNEIDSIEDPVLKAAKLNEALQNALAEINFSTDEAKRNFWDGLMKLVAVDISDGKITWEELSGLSKYVFDNVEELKVKIK